MSRKAKVPTKKYIPDMPEIFEGNWYTIPTIGDGSCLIHSVLQAVSKNYRKSNSKGDIADKIRIGMAYEINKSVKVSTPYVKSLIDFDLSEEDVFKLGIVINGDKYYERTPKWFAAGGGVFLNMFYQNINAYQSALNERIIDNVSKQLVKNDPRNVKLGSSSTLNKPSGNPNELLVDYSLFGILHLMNSSAYIGDELINLVADYFNVNIIMLDQSGDNTRILHRTVRPNTKEWDFVVVSYSPGHYETVGCKLDDDYFQYCFPHDHPMVAKLIPSDYDLGLTDDNPNPYSTDQPAYIPPSITDNIQQLSDAVITQSRDQILMVNVEDPAYTQLSQIEGFEAINSLSHFAILLHLRDILATQLPSYYNLLRHIFTSTNAIDRDIIDYVWPSIIDAPVSRNNEEELIPEYDLYEPFYGYDILDAMLKVYNLDQNTLATKIDESGSIGGAILAEYTLLLTAKKE